MAGWLCHVGFLFPKNDTIASQCWWLKWVNVNRYSGIQERYKQWSIALILECVLYIGLML